MISFGNRISCRGTGRVLILRYSFLSRRVLFLTAIALEIINSCCSNEDVREIGRLIFEKSVSIPLSYFPANLLYDRWPPLSLNRGDKGSETSRGYRAVINFTSWSSFMSFHHGPSDCHSWRATARKISASCPRNPPLRRSSAFVSGFSSGDRHASEKTGRGGFGCFSRGSPDQLTYSV